MLFNRSVLLAAAAVAAKAATVGFTTYKEILAGADNSGAIQYNELDRSNTIFLYLQIIAGQDHSAVIDNFKTLCQNYGEHDISVIPRVRYGNADGSIATEPSDSDQLLTDVTTWASVFANVSDTINIPVLQAGFLGQWGEWHDGPLTDDLTVKRAVVEKLATSGLKVAIRYPADHKALFDGDRSVTIHNDCIFNGGPDGDDGGTFPADDRQTWIDYTKQVAGGNTYGGEGCNQAGDSSYDWSNFDDVCGSNGLASYVNEFQISYFNPGNPAPFQDLFNDPDYADCVATIQYALRSYQ